MFYVCGYLISWINEGFLGYLTLNPHAILFKGQVWRLVTWLIVPPERFDFWTLIMLYFYYSIGTTLENTWGTYRYNLYLFLGMIFTAAGAFAMMGFFLPVSEGGGCRLRSGIFLFAAVHNVQHILCKYVDLPRFCGHLSQYADTPVFLSPHQGKILGMIYGIMLVYEFIVGYVDPSVTIANRFVIAASLLNFAVFFLTSRNMIHMSPKQVKRRQEFRREVKKSSKITRHKCAVCGRTEESNPELEFRFCSKCDGNYEYCQEHLFTHTHVKHK